MEGTDVKNTIRLERAADYTEILRLTFEAFMTLNYAGRKRVDEHYLVHLLRGSQSVISELCFVAELAGKIAGHILYTHSGFTRPDGSLSDTITFGPLSVLPEYQRRGVGRALVCHSLKEARRLGFGAVLITGVPEYYPKLGFRRASEYGLTLEDGSLPDFFMVYELQEGYLNDGGVFDRLAPEFDKAENNDAGIAEFHRDFIEKFYPDKLILRLFYDDDLALMERWLYAEHVKPWYERPADWLHEINNRHGEFAFITHMIAEYNGAAIGFCQYYDCWHSRDYEDWGMEISAPGEVYSIDYLIGEPEYLRRGHAKGMILQMLDKLKKLGAKTIIVLPDAPNTASNRTLETCGFAWDGERYVMQV